MTIAEAIKILDVYASVNGSGRCTQEEYETAIRMAISALKSQKTTVHMEGLPHMNAEEIAEIIKRGEKHDSN